LLTTRGVSAGFESSGNLQSKLQKADKTILPSETFKSNAFLTQFINKSNESSKTSIERITITDEPISDLANLIRKL